MPKGHRRHLWVWFAILAIVYVCVGVTIRKDEAHQGEVNSQELKTAQDNSTKLLSLFGLIPPIAQDVTEIKTQLARNQGRNVDARTVKDLEMKTDALQKALADPELVAAIEGAIDPVLSGQKNTSHTNPPPDPTLTRPQKCEELEVHLVRPLPSNFNFPEQRIGTSNESIHLGASCLLPRDGEPEAKLLFTLQGPFYFFDGGGQTLIRPVVGVSPIHIGILFRPAVVGPASGTLHIFSPDGARITTKGFDNPAKLSGIGTDQR